MAATRGSDPGRIKKETTDIQRDDAAKGGPAAGIGDPQNRHVPTPLSDDLGLQAAVKSTDKPENKDNKED